MEQLVHSLSPHLLHHLYSSSGITDSYGPSRVDQEAAGLPHQQLATGSSWTLFPTTGRRGELLDKSHKTPPHTNENK